ncbi:hypothetical protein DITRI_Ditri06bG0106700 [Diplodiscus trichospermus]
MEVVARRAEGKKSLHEGVFNPNVRVNNGNGEVSCGSRLSEHEMIGAKIRSNELSLNCVMADRDLLFEAVNIVEEGEHSIKALVDNVGVMEERNKKDPAKCTLMLSEQEHDGMALMPIAHEQIEKVLVRELKVGIEEVCHVGFNTSTDMVGDNCLVGTNETDVAPLSFVGTLAETRHFKNKKKKQMDEILNNTPILKPIAKERDKAR